MARHDCLLQPRALHPPAGDRGRRDAHTGSEVIPLRPARGPWGDGRCEVRPERPADDHRAADGRARQAATTLLAMQPHRPTAERTTSAPRGRDDLPASMRIAGSRSSTTIASVASSSRRMTALAAALVASSSVARVARADPPDPDAVVQVLAPHRDVGETTVRREDTRDLPGTFGDPTRFAETLPGVVPTASGLQAFFVRGAPPTATGHVHRRRPGAGPLPCGLRPERHPPRTHRPRRLLPGRAACCVRPLRRRRRSARPPRRRADHPHAEANVRVFDAGALARVPFADGQGSALVAARYGYPGVILPLFSSGTRASRTGTTRRARRGRSTTGTALGVFVFGSDDVLTQVEQNSAGTASYPQQARGRRVPSRRPALGPRHSGRRRRCGSRRPRGATSWATTAANAIDDIARLRVELDARPSRDVRIRAGADVQFDRASARRTARGCAARAAPPSRRRATPSSWGRTRTPRGGCRARSRSPRACAPTSTRRPLPVGEHARFHAAAPADPRRRCSSRASPRAYASRPGSRPSPRSACRTSSRGSSRSTRTPRRTSSRAARPACSRRCRRARASRWRCPRASRSPRPASSTSYFGLPDITACAYGTSESRASASHRRRTRRPFGLEVLAAETRHRAASRRGSRTRYRDPSDGATSARIGPGPTMTILSEYDRTHVVSAVASYDLGTRLARRRPRLRVQRPAVHARSRRPARRTRTTATRLPGFFRHRCAPREGVDCCATGRDRIAVVIEGVNVTLNKEVVSRRAEGGRRPRPRSGVRAACR